MPQEYKITERYGFAGARFSPPLLPTHTHWDFHWLAGAWAGMLSTSKAEISPLGCPRHKEVSAQRSSRWEESPRGPTEGFEESWLMGCWLLLREHREAIRLDCNSKQGCVKASVGPSPHSTSPLSSSEAFILLCTCCAVKRMNTGPLWRDERETTHYIRTRGKGPRSWQETLISRTRGHHRNPLTLVYTTLTLSFTTLF